MKNKIKAGFTKFCQIVYLTISFYIQNNLDASASACTFGFIFSVIPILIMLLTIFIGILHVSPSMIASLSSIVSEYTEFFDVDAFVQNLTRGISFSWVNIILAIFIIWMARKLFISIMQGLMRIFNTAGPSRPIINQLLVFAGELLLMIITTLVSFSAFTTRQLFSLPAFQLISDRFPILFSSLSNYLANITMYIVLFLFTVFAYKFASGTKPKLRYCILCSFLCLTTFYIVIYVLTTFINKANYSTIYGVLSNFMILLLEVYFFFTFFMFFAQCLYIIQFMHSLLLSELYLLPRYDNLKFTDSIRHLLFVTPSALIQDGNTNIYIKNQIIYEQNTEADCVYYITSGTIRELKNGTQIRYTTGQFFGEFEYLLNIKRQGFAVAEEKSKIVKISSDEFSELMQKTPNAAYKAMEKISKQFKKNLYV